jgi:hypothetical protein
MLVYMGLSKNRQFSKGKMLKKAEKSRAKAEGVRYC